VIEYLTRYVNHAVNWEAISAIGQIVGALAVVISLIYVVREIRSNARAALLGIALGLLGAAKWPQSPFMFK